MASLEFSSDFMNSMMYRMLSISSATPYTTTASATLLSNPSSGTAHTQIIIMKGAVPTSLAGMTSISASGRELDMLVRIIGGSTNYGASVSNLNPCSVNSVYVNATRSGTATWFWWSTENLNGQPSPGAGSGPLIHQIIGTIGTIGSGADMEMADTNIVLGQPYRVSGIQLHLPSTWTY